jgi:wobble nucleotide-excising tRNase
MPPTIRKIVARNVGVLKAFDTPSSPRLAKLTTIYARNGRGKTTLSAILRSAASGDASQMQGRRTLGTAKDDPQVTLVMDSGAVHFASGKWSVKSSPIDVFDAAFIADNLYAGEAIDLEHDRGLFTVILGHSGVKLARHQEFFNGVAKRAAAKLKDADVTLRDDVPADQNREEFFAFTPSPALDDEITKAQMDLKAIQQSERLTRLQKLEAVAIPVLADPQDILAQTIKEIDATARTQLAAHFTKFKLGKQGEAWVKFGLEHVHDDQCPFCGKVGVDDQGLLTLYGQIFGAAYQAHLEAIKKAAEAIENSFGPDEITLLKGRVSSNAAGIRSWSEFCDLSSVSVPDIGQAVERLGVAYQQIKSLFDSKRQTPLVSVVNDEIICEAENTLADAVKELHGYNDAIVQIEKLIQLRRAGTTQTESQAKQRLDNLSKRKRRTDAGVQKRIDAALRAKRQDARAKKFRTEVQTRLKAASETSAKHYHSKVNEYLAKFGATFQISKISNSMTGNVGSVDYGLIVRGHPVERGRKSANDDVQTFKNTLSTGDKTTLAFAFFLAGLDRLTGLDDRILVFDDPLSSHDSHRRGKTIDILDSFCKRCAQIIILSHDQYFLRSASNRCAGVDQVAYEIIYDGPENWSKAINADLDELCQSDHARQLRQLHDYFHSRKGSPSHVSPSVRKVLETHYRRSFAAYFKAGENLGPIISSIKKHGATHPCWADVAELESCNSGTMAEHHGDNAEIMSSGPIDPDELHVIVGTCLRLIHAIPPVADSA